MIETLSCPNCNKTVNSLDNTCHNCGMNLAIAAVIAENALTHNFNTSKKLHISPEILVPRLGDYLVERGYLTKDQLEKALNIQKLKNNKGDYKLLGRILVEENLINQEILDAAITEQIASLQNALKQSNIELEDRVRERTNELRQALQKITQLNKIKTNFISNISHELRTPLAHMIGYLELLKDQSLGPLNSDQEHAVSILAKANNRLHNLIDELLQFSLLSQGEMSISQSAIYTETIINKAISHAQNLAHEKKVRLSINRLPKEIRVLADQEKISWVLGELIENGIKFNRVGGQVLVNLLAQNGLIMFIVKDNGIGINKNDINEIFEPFHQLDGSSTRRVGGTGIGLSLANQIIEAHGSKLQVSSIVNQGTTFRFSLPQVQEK